MALQDLRRKRREQWLAKGRNEVPVWVFCNQEGNPAEMQNVKNRHHLKCLTKAGLRTIRFHDLRHTLAALLIQNAEPLAYVKQQLGHSSLKMTVDVYGHLVPGANRQAVNRLPSLRIVGLLPEDAAVKAQQKNLTSNCTMEVLISCKLVELMGIEPTTS